MEAARAMRLMTHTSRRKANSELGSGYQESTYQSAEWKLMSRVVEEPEKGYPRAKHLLQWDRWQSVRWDSNSCTTMDPDFLHWTRATDYTDH